MDASRKFSLETEILVIFNNWGGPLDHIQFQEQFGVGLELKNL